jgi:hypothetical protein
MEEDPHKVPEMPQEDHSDLRSRFVDAHPDMVITTWNEPHRKFIERINRDFMVNGTIPFYEVGEMRVRSDTISQKSGLAMSAEALLKLSKEDVLKDVVATEEEVVYRLNAFFMALEMLNICSYSVPDGPIRYMKALASFRKETPGLAVLLRVDKLIREKIALLNIDERAKFSSFGEELLHVLEHCHYLWDTGRSRAAVEAPSTPVRKRGHEQIDDSAHEGGGAPSPKSKSAKKRARVKQLLADARVTKPPPQAKKGKGKGSSKGSGKQQAPPSSDRIPEEQWKRLLAFRVQGPPRCKFFNSSKGCTMGSICKQKHACLECGGDHSWFAHHGGA